MIMYQNFLLIFKEININLDDWKSHTSPITESDRD